MYFLRTIVAFAFCIFFPIVILGYAFGFWNSPLFFSGNDQVGFETAGSTYIQIAAMLVGIVFGALYHDIKDRTEDIDIVALTKGLIRKPQLYRSLLAAPIVFSGVQAAAAEHTDFLIGLLFAFQNGFFCEVILQDKRKPADE